MLKPSLGCQRDESLGGGRKKWQSLDAIFLGFLHIPRITVRARRPSRDLETSLAYCCPFQLNFLPSSILDKSLCVTAALSIMPRQARQPAKENRAAEFRLQCSVRAQLCLCINVLSEHASSNWAIPHWGNRNSKPGQPSRLSKVTGAYGSIFLLQKGKFFVKIHIANTWKLRKWARPGMKCSRLYLYGKIQSFVPPNTGHRRAK